MESKKIVFAIILCAFLSACGTRNKAQTPSPDGDQVTRLHTDGTWIRDRNNRAVILRGINVGSRSKLPPFLPFEDLDYLDQLAEWGMNSIRLVFTWEGVEPLEGQYDEGYLDAIEALLDGCAQRGILAILDSHQDLYARNFCGDGFPEWAVHPEYREEECPEPFELWPVNYFLSPGVIQSFSRFWSSQELRQAYIRMMLHLAGRFSQHPALIGFDLFNEPYDISYWRFDGTFERDVLVPFFRELIQAMAAHNPDMLFLYGTTGTFSIGFPTYLEAVGLPNVVFGAHWYDGLTLLAGRPGNLPRLRARLEDIAASAADWDVPVYIGEYGVPTNRVDNITYLSEQIGLLEEFFMGSAIWTYNPTDVNWNDEPTSLVGPGGVETPHVGVFVRPYPSRVAGTPIESWFDPASGTLELSFRADPEARGPTQIKVPERIYPDGFLVEVSDGRWERNASRMLVDYFTPQDGEVHTLRLSPLEERNLAQRARFLD